MKKSDFFKFYYFSFISHSDDVEKAPPSLQKASVDDDKEFAETYEKTKWKLNERDAKKLELLMAKAEKQSEFAPGFFH